METILAISEFEDRNYSGFEVLTDKQTIRLYMENFQDCCESWGYFWCNDEPKEFIGAGLLDVTLTDDALNQAVLKSHCENVDEKWFQGGLMFVNIETDRGTLQFVAYNEHNGYYAHDAIVTCTQLTAKQHI